MKPVWLLDVDGVINRFTIDAVDNVGYATFDGGTFVMKWNTKVTNSIRYHGLSGKVDIRWATTWVSEARQLEDLFNLPRFPVAFETEEWTDHSEAKVKAATAVLLEEKRPLIWTDDYAIPQDFMDDDYSVPNFLLIAPNPTYGLSNKHLDSISAFIDTCHEG